MLPKVAIWFAAAFMVAALALGVLTTFEVGLSEAPPRSDDVSERIVNNFEAYEEEYRLWGRWIDLTTALGFVGLLVAVPFLSNVNRSRHILVAGAAMAVVGELIDLSKLSGLDIGRFALDNELAPSFSAANMFRTGINVTSTYVWIGGLFLFALGLLILALDSQRARWRGVSVVFAGALFATGVTGAWASSPWPEAAFTILVFSVVLWAIEATRHLHSGVSAIDGRQ